MNGAVERGRVKWPEKNEQIGQTGSAATITTLFVNLATFPDMNVYYIRETVIQRYVWKKNLCLCSV